MKTNHLQKVTTAPRTKQAAHVAMRSPFSYNRCLTNLVTTRST